MRALLTLAPLLLTVALAGCTSVQPGAKPAIEPPTAAGCEVADTIASCTGAWAPLADIKNPQSITQISMATATDDQPELSEFTNLTSIQAFGTPLDLNRIPAGVTDVTALETDQVTSAPDKRLEQLSLSGTEKIIGTLNTQPASNISARITADNLDLSALHHLNANTLHVTVEGNPRPIVSLEGHALDTTAKDQKLIGAFRGASISSLTVTETP